ncbi:GntR family transcriptional regulator [Massilia sp. B-10]|nr:GntR family transcriptional regulator [Massilia sp. B-10]
MSPSARLPGNPDPSGRLSRYRQIAHKLAAQIDAGVFTADERLPSVRTLMRSENVSVTTAVRVFLHARGKRARLCARPLRLLCAAARFRSRVGAPARTGAARLRRRGGDGQPARGPDAVHAAAAGRHAVRIGQPGSGPAAPKSSEQHPDVDRAPRHRPQRQLFRHSRPVRTALRDRPHHGRARGAVRPGRCAHHHAHGNVAIECALRMCARPGDSVAIESPTYFGMLQAIEAAST